ncbi:MAG: YggS family pyridoxal phosphate-dependent enzyme [Cyanobacteria bacterium P01_D01_bin.105]
MTTAAEISERLDAIRHSIPNSVKLIAVTKTFPAAIVRAAYAAGIRDFAENKVQEALAKQDALGDLTGVTWHFIGHLQSNKSRKVVENFDWVHSVDSLKLATRMHRQAEEIGRRVHCCLQVKLASDPTKDGFEPADLLAALPKLDELSSLDIAGLMVIPPYGLTDEETATIFAAGRSLATQIQSMGLSRVRMDTLSMGMSGDFGTAIAQGSTMIRLGSILFGPRPKKN